MENITGVPAERHEFFADALDLDVFRSELHVAVRHSRQVRAQVAKQRRLLFREALRRERVRRKLARMQLDTPVKRRIERRRRSSIASIAADNVSRPQ